MPRYAKKKGEVKETTLEGVDNSVPAQVSTIVAEVPSAIPEPEVKTLAEEFPTLTKSGFKVPERYAEWRNIKNKRLMPRWGIKHLNEAAEVFEGTTFIRVFTRKIHGDKYLKLAESLVEKKNKLLE